MVAAAPLLLESHALLSQYVANESDDRASCGVVSLVATSEPTAPPSPIPEPKPASPRLSELFESYRRHQQREGVRLNTLDDKAAVVRLLGLICDDKPIDRYGLEDARRFREQALMLTPTGTGVSGGILRSPRYRRCCTYCLNSGTKGNGMVKDVSNHAQSHLVCILDSHSVVEYSEGLQGLPYSIEDVRCFVARLPNTDRFPPTWGHLLLPSPLP